MFKHCRAAINVNFIADNQNPRGGDRRSFGGNNISIYGGGIEKICSGFKIKIAL